VKIILLIFLIQSYNLYSQSKYFEGEIRYHFQIKALSSSNENFEKIIKNIQPEFYSYLIKGNSLCSMVYQDDVYKHIVNDYILWKQNKLYLINTLQKVAKTSNLDNDLKRIEGKIIKTDSVRTILGYECYLYILRDDTLENDYWISSDIQCNVSDAHGLVIKDVGICLRMVQKLLENGGAIIMYDALEIKPTRLKNRLFNIPSDYEVSKMPLPNIQK